MSFLVGYSHHEVICLRFWLLWKDKFAEHLLTNRSHKPDTPTKFLACYFCRELFWSLDASFFLNLSSFWSAWVWRTRTISWMVWKDYYVGQFLGFSLSWTVLCLLRKDYYEDWFPSAARGRGVHIANVVPGPRPRTGFGGGDVEHCPLLWWYAVGADQARKLDVWWLIFQSQCIGNGKSRRLVCPPL